MKGDLCFHPSCPHHGNSRKISTCLAFPFLTLSLLLWLIVAVKLVSLLHWESSCFLVMSNRNWREFNLCQIHMVCYKACQEPHIYIHTGFVMQGNTFGTGRNMGQFYMIVLEVEGFGISTIIPYVDPVTDFNTESNHLMIFDYWCQIIIGVFDGVWWIWFVPTPCFLTMINVTDISAHVKCVTYCNRLNVMCSSTEFYRKSEKQEKEVRLCGQVYVMLCYGYGRH